MNPSASDIRRAREAREHARQAANDPVDKIIDRAQIRLESLRESPTFKKTIYKVGEVFEKVTGQPL